MYKLLYKGQVHEFASRQAALHWLGFDKIFADDGEYITMKDGSQAREV